MVKTTHWKTIHGTMAVTIIKDQDQPSTWKKNNIKMKHVPNMKMKHVVSFWKPNIWVKIFWLHFKVITSDRITVTVTAVHSDLFTTNRLSNYSFNVAIATVNWKRCRVLWADSFSSARSWSLTVSERFQRVFKALFRSVITQQFRCSAIQ